MAGRRRAVPRLLPEIRITTTTYGQVDTRLAFGHVAEPGTYMTTVTRPDLFRNYLTQQIGLLIQNHGVPVYVGPSTTPIPVHFAVLNDAEVQVPQEGAMAFPLRDAFDVPDLQSTHDDIVNGFGFTHEDGSGALAPSRRSASTIRWRGCRITPPPCPSISRTTSCSRTTSSTWTSSWPSPARRWPIPTAGYTRAGGPGNDVITDPDQPLNPPSKLPQMPTYHLTRDDGAGSRWSISGSVRRTRRRRRTTSPCCARMSG
jgi:AMP nucleosidase